MSEELRICKSCGEEYMPHDSHDRICYECEQDTYLDQEQKWGEEPAESE